jgi:hypothetical protein
MAIDSNRFLLQNAIKKILDDPNSRPALPVLEDGSSVGDGNFGKGDRYDTGKSPDITLNNGNVVIEVHESQAVNTLWYRVGKVEGKKIAWGNDEKSVKYDDGVQPSVAITNNGLVVEVHKSQGAKHTLWHRVGRVKGDTIDWGNDNKSIEYDKGVQPSVAITNDGLVVEVHKSENFDTLYYHVGRVEGDRITWGGSHDYDKGVQPSVAITNDGLVVEVHKSENFDSLYYHVGRVNGDKIDWGKSQKYDDGVQPSVAITNDGLVVEVHKSQSHDTLWYSGTGQVNNNTIDWDNDKSQNYSNGEVPKVACNGQLAVETHKEGSDKLLCSVLTLPAFRSNWIELHGENSYCYCACNSATDNKQRHASDKTMNVKEGAPYLYAVLTKDDDSIDFPTGAIMTITGPDGTNYDHDLQEENQLVVMSGSSVRCLIVKDPKPGDWKMTMTVPEGVGFHCECNTVPTTDVYDTMTDTLENPLQKRFLSFPAPVSFTGLGSILSFEVSVPVWGWGIALFTVAAVGLAYVLQDNGEKKELPPAEQEKKGKNILKELTQNAGISKPKEKAKKLLSMSSINSKKKKKEDKPEALLTWNMQGANWNDVAASPWYAVKDWFVKGRSQQPNDVPYKIVVACFQECGSPPPSLTPDEVNVDGIVGLEKYFWPLSERDNLYLYILFHRWDTGSGRVNLAIVSTTSIDTRMYIQGPYRPLIGIQNGNSFFFSIHAASGNSQGGDAWPLLRDVKQQVNSSWWVAGDYNQDPALLMQRLNTNGIDVTVCPPAGITRPASSAKLDYAVREQNAQVIVGDVPGLAAGLSDHLAVFYRL